MRLTIKRLFSYIPTPIPTGMTQFQAWLNSVVELAGPIADADSLKWVISNEVMRLSSTRDKVPKAFFVKSLRKYAANQLAAATVMELKQRQEAAAKAAQEEAIKKQAEDTAITEAADNGDVQKTQ